MQIFKIHYVLLNGNVIVVGIVADNREQAIETLHSHQKNIKSIERIFIGDQIHIIADHILKNLINNSKEISTYKKEIMYLKNLLLESDDEIHRLQEMGNEPVTSVNMNEVAILHDKIVELETEKMELMEGKTAPKIVEKIVNKEVEKIVEVEKFICPECLKDFKSATGVKMHYKKMHKEMSEE